MNPAWYRQVRAAAEVTTGNRTDPDAWIPDPAGVLFGIPVSVRDDGEEPHLEMTDEPSGQLDALIDRVQRDPHDAAVELAREAFAPKPLAELPASTMLAVASVPGKHPEEWREAWPLWMAYPHAAGADITVEMTAAQLRARLAAMDAS